MFGIITASLMIFTAVLLASYLFYAIFFPTALTIIPTCVIIVAIVFAVGVQINNAYRGRTPTLDDEKKRDNIGFTKPSE